MRGLSTVTVLAGAVALCPLKPTTKVAVYADTAGGVGPDSYAWTTAFWAWFSGPNPDLHWVELNSDDVANSCVLADHAGLLLYVQPGGDAFNQSQALGPTGRDNILNYLFNLPSSHYMGTCAGAYYASGTYWWQGTFYGDYYFTVRRGFSASVCL
jgi:glutamine amidotransferase-like uncharacterized protein